MWRVWRSRGSSATMHRIAGRNSRCWGQLTWPHVEYTSPMVRMSLTTDMRQIPEDFIHRVGHAGRMGSAGRASTLVSGAEIGELRSMERALKLKIARKHVNASVRTAARAIQKHAADTHAVAYARASTLVGSHCSDKPRRGARLLSIERLRLGNSSAAIAVRRYLCGPFSERASVPELASLAFSRPASGRRNGASHL